MNRTNLITTLVGFVVLVGCSNLNGSFNRYDIHLPSPSKLPDTKSDPVAMVAGDTQLEETSDQECDLSPFMKIDKMPELPVIERKMKIAEIELIERQHIADLRAFVIEVKRAQAEKIERFQKHCYAVKK